MKDFGRKIKISDLLRHPGKEDRIAFEKKFLPEITTITEEGLSGVIIVKALDRYSVLITIENLRGDLMDISDISGKEYIRHAHNELYEALFIIPQLDKKGRENSDESIEYFEISEKDESIDITQCIENALVAVEPVVKHTEEENENLSDGGEDVESDYDKYA